MATSRRIPARALGVALFLATSHRSLCRPPPWLSTRWTAIVGAGQKVRVGIPEGPRVLVAAVALNVTSTEAAAGFVTVYPAGDSGPLVSNLNLVAGGPRSPRGRSTR